MRPADATETAEAWRAALNHRSGPVALSLTRQKVPVLEGTETLSTAAARPVQAHPRELRCALQVPDPQVGFLFETAVRTLILHAPADVYAGPYTYKRFWFRDTAFALHAMLCAGLFDRAERAIDRLEMAHIAYNRLDRAEFILRRPTPVEDNDGKPLCHVLHFSEVREDRAVNQILAGEDT